MILSPDGSIAINESQIIAVEKRWQTRLTITTTCAIEANNVDFSYETETSRDAAFYEIVKKVDLRHTVGFLE